MTHDRFPEVIRCELRGDDTACAEGLTATGRAPVLQLCRDLITKGHDVETWLEAFRDDVMCLRVKGLGKGAQLTVDERDARFCRWKAFLSPAGSPPMRVRANSLPPSLKNALALTGAAALP